MSDRKILKCPHCVLLIRLPRSVPLQKRTLQIQNTVNNLRKTEDRKISSGNKVKVAVSGTCCVKIYSKKYYRGESEILYPGHNGNYNLDKIRSYKFQECMSVRGFGVYSKNANSGAKTVHRISIFSLFLIIFQSYRVFHH